MSCCDGRHSIDCPAIEISTAELTDMHPGQLADITDVFIEAHRALPNGLSVEVGTRRGGSALQFLRVLRGLYAGHQEPTLITVDPYGYKPYESGIPGVEKVPLYGENEYLAMKSSLVEFSNHMHFSLESLEFFSRMLGCPHWAPGEKPYLSPTQPGKFPLGEAKLMGSLTFCLLDGDHSASTIAAELHRLLVPWRSGVWMNPRGIVVVDNVECDPGTIPMLDAYKTEIRTNELGGKWAIVRGLR